jgi:hypothetical protein
MNSPEVFEFALFFEVGDRRMVDQLNEEAIGIVKIERSGTVPVGFRLGCESDVQGAHPVGPDIDVFRALDDETDMVNGLNGRDFGVYWKLVEGEIILPRGEVGILFVGHPLQFHPEDLRVKLKRPANAPDVEGDVTQAQKWVH